MIKINSTYRNLCFVLFCFHLFSSLGLAQENNSGNVLKSTSSSSGDSYDEGIRKVFARTSIEKQARLLEKQGLYDEAIVKYKEALNPSLINQTYEGSTAHGGIMDVYIKQGKFEEALKELQWFITTNYNPAAKPWLDQQIEIEALIKARGTHSNKPVYEYIQYLKEKYKKSLPPKKVDVIIATLIIRLYDTIGDYDAGIVFVDGFLNYYAKKAHVKPEKIGPKNPYLQIKQAFLQDKAEGRKSCISAKPGEVCMGRATKVLIQSDYFPY